MKDWSSIEFVWAGLVILVVLGVILKWMGI
jgi:hypothetical protein